MLTAVFGTALIGVSACSPGEGAGDGSPETSGTTPSGEALASVKPCEILPEETLKSFGLEPPGEPTSTLPWKPGCDYSGQPVGARLGKNDRQTVDSAEQKTSWAEFERVQVNGREGARFITKGATKAQSCGVMFNSGEGVVQVITTESGRPYNTDECQKALEIAKKVESNVPEPR
nr:DUF3558 family protein [Actinopolyspora xinjiangensis]